MQETFALQRASVGTGKGEQEGWMPKATSGSIWKSALKASVFSL